MVNINNIIINNKLNIARIILVVVLVSLIIGFVAKRCCSSEETKLKMESFYQVSTMQLWPVPSLDRNIIVHMWAKANTAFVHQADGSLVLYDGGIAKWAIDGLPTTSQLIFDPAGKFGLVDSETNAINHMMFDTSVRNPTQLASKFQGPYKLTFSETNADPNIFILDKYNYIVWMAIPLFNVSSVSGKVRTLPTTSYFVYQAPYLYDQSSFQALNPEYIFSGRTSARIPPASATSVDNVYLHFNMNGTITFVNNTGYALNDNATRPTFSVRADFNPYQQYILRAYESSANALSMSPS